MSAVANTAIFLAMAYLIALFAQMHSPSIKILRFRKCYIFSYILSYILVIF
jgi:hypothetical protein